MFYVTVVLADETSRTFLIGAEDAWDAYETVREQGYEVLSVDEKE